MASTNWNFQSYEKMSESTSEWDVKHMKAFKGKKHNKDKEYLWVVMEKVHGSNLCLITDGKEVKAAKRSEILRDDDDFFGYRTVLEKYEKSVQEAYGMLQNMFPNIQTAYIYGELFGGGYPSLEVEAVEGVELVQTGIHYCPGLEFYAFDIAISTGSHPTYLDYDVCLEVFHTCKLFCAEPLFQGTYEECLAFPIKFESTIPHRLGMPKLNAPNLAEGVVIKPVKNIYVTTMHGKTMRAIVKKKIDLFLETVEIQESKHQAAFGTEKLKNELFAMVTVNRLKNVISKYGRVNGTKAQRSKLQELMVQDILDSVKDKDKLDANVVMAELNKRVKATIDAFFDEKK